MDWDSLRPPSSPRAPAWDTLSPRQRLLVGLGELIDEAGELKDKFGADTMALSSRSSWVGYFRAKCILTGLHCLSFEVLAQPEEVTSQALASVLTAYRYPEDVLDAPAPCTLRKLIDIKRQLMQWAEAGFPEAGKLRPDHLL